MLQQEIETLKDWLKDQDYWQGVKLYERHGSSELLKEMFRSNQDDINQEYLVSQIREIIEQTEKLQQETFQKYPKQLQDQVDSSKRLMDERAEMKTMLRILFLQKSPEEVLKKAAFRILDINDQLTAIYDDERFFNKMGYLPNATDYAIENGEYLLKRLYNVRTYVSRYRNRPGKYEQYEAELFEIEKKLDQLGLIRLDKK